MNRTSNAIRMLEILQVCGKLSKRDLANRLEINERNIYELKKELIEAGYKFIDHKGRNGGYELDKGYIMKIPYLTKDEQESIVELTYFVKNNTKFIGLEDTYNALLKISSQFDLKLKEEDKLVVNTVNNVRNREDLQANYAKINYAKKYKYQIMVKYNSFRVDKIRIVNSYDLFSVDNEWYWTGYDVSDQIFKLFKLIRTKDVEVMNKIYWLDPKYKRDDFIDESGLKNIGKEVRIKLKVTGPYIKTLKENPIGKDVKIIDREEEIIYESTFRGEYKINEFILKMGVNCEVVEPQNVKEEISSISMQILEKYKSKDYL